MNGFTLIELLLVIMVMIAAVTGSFFLTLNRANSPETLRRETRKIATVLREAQENAIREKGGAQAWGVLFSNTSATYAIASAVSGTTTHALPDSLEFSDPPTGFSKHVLFAPLTGLPLVPPPPASIAIRRRANPAVTATIIIGAHGAIDYVFTP